MKIELGLPGLSCVAVSLPLESDLEKTYGDCLPDNFKSASPVRRSEFIAGRYCAFKAGKEVGTEISYLPVGVERGPQWPSGIIGSISHSGQMAIACVGRANIFRSVGIDTEVIIPSETIELIQHAIMNGTEKKLLGETGEHYRLGHTVLFSGKEALFKALFPIYQIFLDFKDAQLTSLSLSERTFSLTVSGLRGSFQGRFVIQDNNIITVLPINYRGRKC